MKSGRALVLAVLVYVALDFSSPAIPGAFVFEPGDSVESVARGRTTTNILATPVLLGYPILVVLVRLDDESRAASAVIAPTAADSPRPAARTAIEPPSPSEDPH